MKTFFILLCLFINCNRGPAEDRGRKACTEARQQFLLTYLIANDPTLPETNSNKKFANNTLPLVFAGIDLACGPWHREEWYSTYYRGYVLNKK